MHSPLRSAMGPLIQVFETSVKQVYQSEGLVHSRITVSRRTKTPLERPQKAVNGASIHDVGERANLTYVGQSASDGFATGRNPTPF
jgi:hypothetical protein